MKETTDFIPKRMAVAIAILILYFVHYATLALSTFFNKGQPKEYIDRRIFLFGIAGLLSMSFNQAGIYQAVLAWFTLVPLLALHATNFSQFSKLSEKKDFLWLAYYGLQFAWFFGIIVDFYTS